MTLILDTHAFIWSFSEPGSLSSKARELCEDTANTLLLSVVSIAEMQIKIQLGKLTLGAPLPKIIEAQLQQNIQLLALEPAHIYLLQDLPSLHRDPFDRLLIAQANAMGASLLSSDRKIADYPVSVLW